MADISITTDPGRTITVTRFFISATGFQPNAQATLAWSLGPHKGNFTVTFDGTGSIVVTVPLPAAQQYTDGFREGESFSIDGTYAPGKELWTATMASASLTHTLTVTYV